MGGVTLNSLEQDSLALARHIVDVIVDQKGEDVVLIDIRDISILADCFVIGGVTSTRHTKAIIEDIRKGIKDTFSIRPILIEGEADSGWVLMDYGNVIVHLFTPEMRAYYDLEGLWVDAIDVWQRAERVFPDNSAVYYNLGLAYEALGRYDEAEDYYGKANLLNGKKLYRAAVKKISEGRRKKIKHLQSGKISE